MNLNKINYGEATPEQQMAIQAIETFEEMIRNTECLSNLDVPQVLLEIKTIHSLYKEAFNRKALCWQVKCYSIQMALENEYKFIFAYNMKMTWTQKRWNYAIVHELAIASYNHKEGDSLEMDLYGYKLMCYWLFFQYFDVSVFKGEHSETILSMSLQIAENVDSEVYECIQTIKQWRKDNDEVIRKINYEKTKWRREAARIHRWLHGRMFLKDIQRYHILHYFDSRISFEQNVSLAAYYYGVSFEGMKRRCKEFDIDERNYQAMIIWFRDEDEIEYQRQYKWASKVASNSLTKKEKREFWKEFTIPNPQLLFRTFTSQAKDLIPADNPLLTDETCLPPEEDPVEMFLIPRKSILGPSVWPYEITKC